ncbi:MAG: hypothetical protein P1V97_32140 [Planctomycetota bacterium]|nr:hypothetical protein [Planctomycetota bacterium]
MSRILFVGMALLAFSACGSGEKKKDNNNNNNKPIIETVSPDDLDDINNCVSKLSNANLREKWRARLVTIASQRDVNKRKIVDILADEYRKARSGSSRTLNEGGRERAIFVLAEVGDGNAKAEAVVKEALTDPNAGARLTAAEKYAKKKDPSILPDLLKSAARPEKSTADRLMKVLMVYASPESRAEFLKAVTFENLTKMVPVVDKTLSSDRASDLLDILKSTDNPAAAAYATRSLTSDNNGDALSSIQSAKKRLSNAKLSVEVYNSLSRFAKSDNPPAGILKFYVDELSAESSTPKVAAEKLAGLGTVAAIQGLATVAMDESAPEKSRVAVLEVLSSLPLKLRKNDAQYKGKREAALKALRAGIEYTGGMQKASAIGIGRFQDAGDANRLDRALSDSTSLGNCGAEIIAAMAMLDGDRALSRLLGRLKTLSSQRKSIESALGKKTIKEWKKRTHLFRLVDYLRAPDEALRRSAQNILLKVTGENIRFDPTGDVAERKDAAVKWTRHIKSIDF